MIMRIKKKEILPKENVGRTMFAFVGLASQARWQETELELHMCKNLTKFIYGCTVTKIRLND